MREAREMEVIDGAREAVAAYRGSDGPRLSRALDDLGAKLDQMDLEDAQDMSRRLGQELADPPA